jgi:hypothetical protein
VTSSEYAVVQYDSRHRDALFDFRAAHYGAESARTNPAYVDWLYSDAYQAQPDRPALFVCISGERIVGTQGMLHVRLNAGDERLGAAWVVDFAVRKELQRQSGIGSSIGFASQQSTKVRLALDVSRAAVGVALRLGWQHVCDLPLWVRPLDLRKALPARSSGLMATGLGAIGQTGLDALLHRGLRIAHRRRLELIPTGAFDERADSVWSSVSSGYAVICRRDRAYLQWRFDRFPGADAYSRFWLKDANGVVGYIVLRIGEHKGRRSGFIIDYLCRPDDVSSLMAMALAVCRDAGAILTYCTTLHPSANTAFRPLGYLRRRSGWPFMIYTEQVAAHTARLMSKPSNWFVTAGDSNLDHLRALPSTPSTSGQP